MKVRHIEVFLMLYRKISNDKFIDRIVTCDIKWNFYDRRNRSNQWPYQDQTRKQFPKEKMYQQKIKVTV